MYTVQGSGAWPCAGLSFTEFLIVIQMVHTQKCAHNVSTEIILVSQQQIN